ncbi:MAG: caspase family protein [Chloroflexota bacterium]
MAEFTQGHALVIGIGNYQHRCYRDVPATVADAQALADVLRDPRYCGYPAQQVTLLQSHETTRESVLRALDDLISRTAENDTVVFFYSGHGDYDKANVYQLTTYDTERSSYGVVDGTAISHHELLARFRAIKAKRVLLVFNSCHAGALSPTLGSQAEFVVEGQMLSGDVTASLLATGEGRAIIAASRENQFSFVGGGKLTVFAQALVEGLQGQGRHNRASYISLFDLYQHVYDKVGQATRELVQYLPRDMRQQHVEAQQEPELTLHKGVGPFAVALWPGSTPSGDFLAPDAPPTDAAVRLVEPQESQRIFQSFNDSAHSIAVTGDTTESQFATATGAMNIRVGDISGVSGQVGIGKDITQINAPTPHQQTKPGSGRLAGLLREGLEAPQLNDLVLTLEDKVDFEIELAAFGNNIAAQIDGLIRLCRKQNALGALIESVLEMQPPLLGTEQELWRTWARSQDYQ